MFERLSKYVRMPLQAKDTLTSLNIPILLMQAYKTGCVASECQQHELARLAAWFIFDTLDYVRTHFSQASLETIALETPKGFSAISSIPYPRNMEQLEEYTEKYLIGIEGKSSLQSEFLEQRYVL